MAGLHSEMIDTGREYFRNLPSELIRRHGDLVVAKPSPAMYPIVALTAAVGARRNEVLALRWTDLDVENKTLRIERAWEPTKKFGLRLKPPKTARGLRTVALDDGSVAMLLKERERHQRICAGVPDGADVDLSLCGCQTTR